jgi:dienelactone hydrolase
MGALTAEGALIYDENVSGRRPAVLAAPNWMGMTDKAIQRGELAAGNRYVVFVADMYGAGTRPADFGEAAALANPLRADAIEQRKRVRAAFETMIAQAKARNLIDGRRAAIGFYFGGGNVLELAREGVDLAAAVSNHGDLKTALPAEKGRVKAALLVAHGAPDPVAPKADRDAFEAEMNAAGTKWQMVVFQGFSTPIPIRAQMRLELPPGTNRPRDRPTRSPINSWPMASPDDCESRAYCRVPGKTGLRTRFRWLTVLSRRRGR